MQSTCHWGNSLEVCLRLEDQLPRRFTHMLLARGLSSLSWLLLGGRDFSPNGFFHWADHNMTANYSQREQAERERETRSTSKNAEATMCFINNHSLGSIISAMFCWSHRPTSLQEDYTMMDISECRHH